MQSVYRKPFAIGGAHFHALALESQAGGEAEPHRIYGNLEAGFLRNPLNQLFFHRFQVNLCQDDPKDKNQGQRNPNPGSQEKAFPG